MVSSVIGLWPTKRSLSAYRHFPFKLLIRFQLKIRKIWGSNEDKSQTLIKALRFFFSMTHLMTPQVYLVTLQRAPNPRLGTSELNHIPVYKVVFCGTNTFTFGTLSTFSWWYFYFSRILKAEPCFTLFYFYFSKWCENFFHRWWWVKETLILKLLKK